MTWGPEGCPGQLSRRCLSHPSHSRFRSGEVGGAAPVGWPLLCVVCGSLLREKLPGLWQQGCWLTWSRPWPRCKRTSKCLSLPQGCRRRKPRAVQWWWCILRGFAVLFATLRRYSIRAQPDGCWYGGSGALRVHEPLPVRLGETKQIAAVL